MRQPSAYLSLALLAVAGCSSTTSATDTPTAEATAAEGRRSGPEIGIEAEIGALDESAVVEAFNKSANGMLTCFKRGSERIDYLSGVVKVSIRVSSSGTVRAFMKHSTLGDRATEECMLKVLLGKSWPAPVGGREGIAENDFTFEAREGVREPVGWSAGDAGKNVEAATQALGECRKSASSGRLSATFYVDPDGKVKSVGVSGDDANSERAADCVVRAIKDVKFNTPGSFDAKLTLTGQ